MKYTNIVISGDIGTGTSTLATGLSQKLGWPVLTFGQLFRQFVKDNNIPLWDKMAVPAEWEYKTDQLFHEKLKNEEHLIVDGHYQAWLNRDQKHVFRILLTLDPEVASQRILQRVDHMHTETPETIQKRREGLKTSFKKLYGAADYFNPQLFDLIIDTGKNSIPQTLEQAFTAFQQANS